jgi:hypothetical protein
VAQEGDELFFHHIGRRQPPPGILDQHLVEICSRCDVLGQRLFVQAGGTVRRWGQGRLSTKVRPAGLFLEVGKLGRHDRIPPVWGNKTWLREKTKL